MRFAVTSSQNVNPADDPRGTCTEASCFPPSTPIAIAGTTVVRFFDFTFPGSPNIVDPTSLVGIQWQMDTPPGVACNASFSIDDIRFVNAPPAPRLSFTFDKDTQGWVLNDFLPAAPCHQPRARRFPRVERPPRSASPPRTATRARARWRWA